MPQADPDDTGNEPSDDGEESSVIKALRKEIKQLKGEAESGAQARRELMLTRAGLDGLSDKQVKALVATHEGEMTADALKATAEELGWTKTEAQGQEGQQQSQPQGQQPPQQHRDQMTIQELREMQNLSNSPASHEQGSGPMSQEAFDEKVNSVIKEGGPDALMEWMRQNSDLPHFQH